MTTLEILRLIFEFLLSGTLIVTLVTLRATRRKAQEEARQKAIDNDKSLIDSFNEYIVKPLKNEVNALRRDVRRLNRVIEKAGDCNYAEHPADCPVLRELQNSKEYLPADDNTADQ